MSLNLIPEIELQKLIFSAAFTMLSVKSSWYRFLIELMLLNIFSAQQFILIWKFALYCGHRTLNSVGHMKNQTLDLTIISKDDHDNFPNNSSQVNDYGYGYFDLDTHIMLNLWQ